MADNSWLTQQQPQSKFLTYGNNYNAANAFKTVAPTVITPQPVNSFKSWTPSYSSKSDIINFQKAMGLTPDGIIGSKTKAAYAQMGVNAPMNIKSNTGGSTSGSKYTSSSSTQGKKIALPDGQNVSQYMTPEGDVASGLIYPASSGITNQNANTRTVTPSDLSTLSFANGVNMPKDSEWAGQGENVLGYLGTPVNQQVAPVANDNYTHQVDTSQWTQDKPVTVDNNNPSSAFLNNANSPAKVAGQVYWDNNGKPYVYQQPYAPTGDTFKDMYAQQLMQQTSPADAWSKVGWGDAWNKGEGISGGLSNLWDKATAQTGNAMNPQASALEKAFGGLSSAANIYSALQNTKYQSKLADLYGQQVDLQRRAQEQTLANQKQAQSNYENSFKVG